MAIRAGSILHYQNGYLVERLQSGGPGDLTINRTKIYELGNYQTVGVVQDNPTLTFAMEALDVSADIEASIQGIDPMTVTDGTKLTFSAYYHTDVVSPWKDPYGAFTSPRSVAIPFLGLESFSYRYGVTDNAGATFNFRGDSLFYVPGRAVVQKQTGNGSLTSFTFMDGATTVTALPYVNQGVNNYALSVTVDWTKMTLGVDYTETSAGITFTTPPANNAKIQIVFGYDNTATGNPAYPQTIHHVPGTTPARPAAITGKDIVLSVRPYNTAGTGGWVRWTDVQNFTTDWRVTVEDDYELGNAAPVAREPTDVPQVSGTVELRARNINALFTKIYQVTGVTTGQIVGPQSSVLMDVAIQLLNPAVGGAQGVAVGAVLKTIRIPDARFTLPGYRGQANQKTNSTISWDSDSGAIEIYKGKASTLLPFSLFPKGESNGNGNGGDRALSLEEATTPAEEPAPAISKATF